MRKLMSIAALWAVCFVQVLSAEECVVCEPSCCVGTFGAGGEWLYWRAEESRLEYGAEVDGLIVDNTLNIKSKVLRPKFQYDNGYRVFLDYTTWCDDWRFAAILTHAPAHARNDTHTSSMLNSDFISIFNTNFPILSAIAGLPVDNLNSKWDASVYYVDFDVSRTWACECFQIIPHIGIRGLWSDQTLNLNGSAESEEILFNSNLKSKLSGAGLEGGLKAAWQLYEGFSLVGNVGGSVIYASYRNKGTLSAVAPENPALSVQYNDRNYKTTTMFDAFIGLEYKTCIDQYGLSFLVGWEEHIIYDTNEFSIAGSGNMTFQGLTLGGGVSF